MTSHGFLEELVLVYGLAVVLLLIGARFRVPSIVALIVAGVIAGPAGAGLMTSAEDVDLLSEVGVALLLFTAGLEFSLTELRRLWRTIVPGGVAQVVLTAGVTGGLVALGAGGTMSRIAVVGLFVALSSTAVVLKELARRNHLHTPHGRLTIGVLLLQDIVVIAVLAAAPTLLGVGVTANQSVATALGRLAVVGGGVLLLGRFLLPLLLRTAATWSREAFALSVLLASVGTAMAAQAGGLSMAAGAFLAGLILAEGEFSHQVHADIRPLRDLLASLFFISVGMLIDIRAMLPVAGLIALFAVAIMIVKSATAVGALLLIGAPARVSFASALALAQVGEFSFVLGRTALQGGVISAEWWQVLLGASVVTMALTPTLVAIAPSVAARLAERWGARTPPAPDAQPQHGHVVILGYGVGGQLVARSLSELSVPHVVLELNGATVREARERGVNIHYADVAAPEPLHAAGVAEAAAVVALISDPDGSERAVRAIRELAPDVPIIARTRYRLEAERLARSGATLAVAEELEASLEVLSQLLMRLHIPGNLVETLVETYRRAAGAHGGGRAARAPAIPLDQLPREIAHAPVQSFRLPVESWAAGKTLQLLDLRNGTGATVLAVRRGGHTTTSPLATFTLEAGDDLFLLGDDSDITLARAFLTKGPRARVDRGPARDRV